MEDVVVYSKRSGESPVPVTVRIDWLQDGTIMPVMFWTPDDVCYKVISLHAGVPLAFLKERGEGLRFEVTGEVIESDDEDLLHARYETYLYLVDTRFYQRNIVDERYSHAGKEYIPVTLDVFPDADYELVYFWVQGVRYMVEKTLDVAPRGSFRAGGVGVWHKVKARQVNADDDEDPDPHKSVLRLAALYLELNKWFVATST